VVLIILKNISQREGLSHILWKIKNYPNHQPAIITITIEISPSSPPIPTCRAQVLCRSRGLLHIASMPWLQGLVISLEITKENGVFLGKHWDLGLF
jgi:hypothetical protein